MCRVHVRSHGVVILQGAAIRYQVFYKSKRRAQHRYKVIYITSHASIVRRKTPRSHGGQMIGSKSAHRKRKDPKAETIKGPWSYWSNVSSSECVKDGKIPLKHIEGGCHKAS